MDKPAPTKDPAADAKPPRRPYQRPAITGREVIETIAASCVGPGTKALGNTDCQNQGLQNS